MAFYPFDPNGNLVSNLINDEPHTLTSANGVDYQYLVPRDAPFFDRTMVVVDAGTGEILTKGVDYDLGWKFDAGLSEVGEGLSGAVYLLDQNRNGNFKIRYQTLGGDFVTSATRAINDGLKTFSDLTVVTWDDINPTTIPTSWPPTPHTHPVTEVEAVQEVIDAINNVANALLTAPPYIHVSDIIDFDDQYRLPMMSKLDDIAQAIRDSNNKSLYYETFSVPFAPSMTVTSPNATDWYDIGLVGSVTQDGTYMVNHSVNLEFPGGDNFAYKVRVVYSNDGGVTYGEVPQSSLNGGIVGMSAGMLAKVQVRMRQAPSEFYVSRSSSGNNLTQALTFVRVGI